MVRLRSPSSMRQGQALIAVLLILGVIMTVALSIASRSTTEVSVSTAQEEAARALTAAEAGVEAKLGGVTMEDIGVPVGNNGSTYTVALTDFGAVGTPLVLPQQLASGESVTVNLAGYAGGNIGVCWGGTGSLETVYYYGSPVVGVARNYFSPVGTCTGYAGYHYQNVSLAAGSPKLFLKLKLLGNGSTEDQLVIVPAANLPKQGDMITSVGQAGESARKVEVNKQDDKPDIFEEALFSGTSLVATGLIY